MSTRSRRLAPEPGSTHYRSPKGRILAERIDSGLRRHADDLLTRGLSLHVYFRSLPAEPVAQQPLPIDLDEAQRIFVIDLVDNGMVLENMVCEQYVQQINDRAKASEDRHRIRAVSLSRIAVQVARIMARASYLHYYQLRDEARGTAASPDGAGLRSTHERTRLLACGGERCRIQISLPRPWRGGRGRRS